MSYLEQFHVNANRCIICNRITEPTQKRPTIDEKKISQIGVIYYQLVVVDATFS